MIGSTAQPKQALLRVLAFILPLLPIIYLVALIAKYGVNVPYADEFTIAPLLAKAHEHTLTFADLFSQHNEHRYFFSRLLMIALVDLAHGDLRAEMYFSVLLTILTSLNLWVLIRRTLSVSLGASLVLLFLINLLLFSPVQAENWTWGFQFPLFFCNYLFTSALLAAFSNLSIRNKYAICLVLALVAMFSFGGGVLLWALTFPLGLLMQPGIRWKSKIPWGVAWGAAGLGAVALYFFHYVKPPGHPSMAASRNPVDYFLYVTTFLGAHLSRADRAEPIFQAALVGTILLVLWGSAVVYAFRYRNDLDLRQRMVPWIVLGSYAVLNGLLAAVARIGFGIHQALDSRYTSFSLYLCMAVVGLYALLRHDSRSRSHRWPSGIAVVRVETILLTAFAAFSLTAFLWGRGFMIDSHRTRLWGKGALLFSNVMDSGPIHDRYLMADAAAARTGANLLDNLGLMRPPLFRTAEIQQLKTKHAEKTAGFLDFISTSGASCSVVGWAVLPAKGTRAHCVVLTYDDPKRGPIAFRVADEIYNREDVAPVLNNPAAENSGWRCHFDRSILPAGDVLLTAWALDANHAI